jgi:hypothetical protein
MIVKPQGKFYIPCSTVERRTSKANNAVRREKKRENFHEKQKDVCLFEEQKEERLKFLIFFPRMVLGVIYVPLLSLLPFKKKFVISSPSAAIKKNCFILHHSHIVSRKFVVQTHCCENLISFLKTALEKISFQIIFISFDPPREKEK